MLKIVHLTSVHPTFDIRIFYKECKTLAKNGYEVILIAKHHKEELVEGIRILPFPELKNRFLRILSSSVKMFFLAIKQKASIYHFHDPELIPVAVLLKLFGKKVIYDVHEDYKKAILVNYYLPNYIRKSIAWTIYFIEQISSIFFDAIISATDDINKNFQNHPISVIVKNHPLLSSFNISGVMQHRKEKINTFKIIYAGSLSPERGITQVIKAMELINNLKKIRLALYGRFSPDSYEKEIRNLKGFEKVDYYGFIDHKFLPEYYNQSDVGIINLLPFSTHISSIPHKLFEYMASGLPVIASNFPLWREIVEGNSCGICVNPMNTKTIAEAIQWIFDHPNEAKQMGENGRKAVAEKYNWDLESKKLLSVYLGLTSGKL
jgi:glycosyltransferase involved in cell wall biosynthesis